MTPKEQQWYQAADRRNIVSNILSNHVKTHPEEWPCFEVESYFTWRANLQALVEEARQYGVENRPFLQLLSHPKGPAADRPAAVIHEALVRLNELDVLADRERRLLQTVVVAPHNPDIAPSDQNTIPIERQTEPMSLAEAGIRLRMEPEAGTKEARRKAAGQRVRRLIESGGLRCMEMGKAKGKKYVFDRDQVPDNKSRLK